MNIQPVDDGRADAIRDLRDALASHDKERAVELVEALVPVGMPKRRREKLLWEMWTEVGFKPPDLPPLKKRPRGSAD